MIKQAIKLSAATALSLGLLSGVAMAKTTGNTGPQSTSVQATITVSACKSISKNNTWVSNTNVQSSSTGKTKVSDNTTGGNAKSGSGTNGNTTGIGVTASNSNNCAGVDGISGSSDDTSGDTGPNSFTSSLNFSLNLQKTVSINNTGVNNTSVQSCSTGSAEVSDNTTGGNATSGDCSNMNSTTVVVNSSN